MEQIKVLAIAPYEGLKQLLLSVSGEFPQVALSVIIGDLEDGAQLAAQAQGMDILLSRGGTARLIEKNAAVPVIDVDVSGYDILRAIRLAESYSGKAVFIAFSGITDGARMICELLRMDIDIRTIRSEAEGAALLRELRSQDISVVIGDVVMNRLARQAGYNSILVTSGIESVRRAMEDAVKTYSQQRVLKEQVLLFQGLVEQVATAVLYSGDGRFLYASDSGLSGALCERLQGHVADVVEKGRVSLVLDEGDRRWRVGGKAFVCAQARYVSFSLQPCAPGGVQDGVRVYNRGERGGLLLESISGNGPWMQSTVSSAQRLAGGDAPVLICGEPGTGKDTLAYSIHLAGPGSRNTFVSLDCEILTDGQWREILEDDALYTPAGEGGVTLYLRHIHCLSAQAQKEIVRFIRKSGAASPGRLIASATRTPEQLLEQGVHAEAFYDIIPFMRIHLCPLRERLEDLRDLASSFISQFNEKYGKQIAGLEKDALEYLRGQRWEGNLDQLKQAVEELVLLCDGPYISLGDVESVLPGIHPQHTAGSSLTVQLDRPLEEITLQVMGAVYEKTGGNLSRAAAVLGVSRSTLWRKLKQGEE